ncbi:MAG: helix-turn-helix domain-containing protein [Pseudomonadota bacterium]
MHDQTDNTVDFPTLSAIQLQVLLGQCADLTILLSNNLTVTDVLGSPDFDGEILQNWKGQRLETLVARDSLGKLAPLLEDNAATKTNETRWRHLNFVVEGTSDLPLLTKFFRFANEGTAHHLICARNLGPSLDIQQRFMRLEATMLKQNHSKTASTDRSFESWKVVAKVVAEIASPGADKEAMDTLASIEKLCILEALKKSNGNEHKAAQLLNISVNRLRRQLRPS